MQIAVIDGQGGGIGKAIVSGLKSGVKDAKILALGTNSTATGQMMKAGADEGATGENAIIYNAKSVDIIVGVIAILNANALMGELTPKMAEAVGDSNAIKVLLPINRCGINVVSVKDAPLSEHIQNAIDHINSLIE